MSVYVDSMNYPYGRMIMCHMLADTEQELHSMADKIGVKRKWFQSKSSYPHYDICLSKKKLAIKFGAVEKSTKEIIQMMKGKTKWEQ